jgi:hypothetical protein
MPFLPAEKVSQKEFLGILEFLLCHSFLMEMLTVTVHSIMDFGASVWILISWRRLATLGKQLEYFFWLEGLYIR